MQRGAAARSGRGTAARGGREGQEGWTDLAGGPSAVQLLACCEGRWLHYLVRVAPVPRLSMWLCSTSGHPTQLGSGGRDVERAVLSEPAMCLPGPALCCCRYRKPLPPLYAARLEQLQEEQAAIEQREATQKRDEVRVQPWRTACSGEGVCLGSSCKLVPGLLVK